MEELYVDVFRRDLERRNILIRRGERPSIVFAAELQRYVYRQAWRYLFDKHGDRLQGATIVSIERNDYQEDGPYHSRWRFMVALTFADPPA